MATIESPPGGLTESTAFSTLPAELDGLYEAFNDDGAPLSEASLARMAEVQLDFRAGRQREDTNWEEGEALDDRQKVATIRVANKWKMLDTTYPVKRYDRLVILGAHYSSLRLRIQHAVNIESEGFGNDNAEIVALSCFRPIHPNEGVADAAIETEADLARSLLSEDLGAKFELDSVSSWDDVPSDSSRLAGEYGVAFIGRIGLRKVTIISGSVPSNATYATTISTLEGLKTLYEDDASLLFVTTALHLPYQTLQIERVMPQAGYEIVGINYPSMYDLSLDSPDAKFRKILQEIGATIKNALVSQ